MWKRLICLVVLLTAIGLISHGTQDLYPTLTSVIGCFVIGFGPEAHGVSFRKQTQRLVVLALLLCAGSTVCLAQEPQAVVDRFHPQQLTASRAAGHTCFMVLRLTSINDPDAIVAAYTDGKDVALRLLTRVAPDTYVVSSETKSSLPASATSCSFTGPDLDGDGQPDVKLEVASGAVSSEWGFKWTGDTLVPRSVPTSR